MRDIEQQNLQRIYPRDYLRRGFFDAKGALRADLNGYDSLATAYHVRTEKMTTTQLASLVAKLKSIADRHAVEIGDHPDHPLPHEVLVAVQKLAESEPAHKSGSITELLHTAIPHLNEWRDFAALVLHMERILAQLALVTTLARADRTPAGVRS